MSMDLSRPMQQAQQMQRRMNEIEAELAETTYEGNTGGEEGVTVVVSGRNEVQEVRIGEELMDPENREMLQDMVIAAVNEAMRAADTDSANNMSRLAGGMNLGGLF